jgi:hypothetical protein
MGRKLDAENRTGVTAEHDQQMSVHLITSIKRLLSAIWGLEVHQSDDMPDKR